MFTTFAKGVYSHRTGLMAFEFTQLLFLADCDIVYTACSVGVFVISHDLLYKLLFFSVTYLCISPLTENFGSVRQLFVACICFHCICDDLCV